MKQIHISLLKQTNETFETIMKHIKPVVFICILGASLIGALYCIHASHTAANPTPKEAFQLRGCHELSGK